MVMSKNSGFLVYFVQFICAKRIRVSELNFCVSDSSNADLSNMTEFRFVTEMYGKVMTRTKSA